jgi:23S rRNA (guanosine2251-2'-O)-methyltransferase
MAKRKKQYRGDANADADGPDIGTSRTGGKAQHYWLYGIHACLAAISNPARQIRRIVIATQSVDTIEEAVCEAANAVLEQYPEAIRPNIECRDRRELEALLPRDAVHQGICLDATPLPYPVIEDVFQLADGKSSACVLVLDQATDPRNIGSVMRTAAALGALAVVVQDKHAPEITGAMAKAASGAIERLPLVRVTNLARTLDQLKQEEFWTVGFDGHATDLLTPKTLVGRNVIVLGAEGAGLRRLTRETCDLLVKIPITESVESLNLSNAAAIALYQFVQSNA